MPVCRGQGDDPSYRQRPRVNVSWPGTPMTYRRVTYASGLGLKSPMHLHYNISLLRVSQPRITHFVAAAGMDAGCDHGGARTPPYNCHDVANWQHSVVKVYLDGALVGESPVLQAETLQWVIPNDLSLGSYLACFVDPGCL